MPCACKDITMKILHSLLPQFPLREFKTDELVVIVALASFVMLVY